MLHADISNCMRIDPKGTPGEVGSLRLAHNALVMGGTDKELCQVTAVLAYMAIGGRGPGPFFEWKAPYWRTFCTKG